MRTYEVYSAVVQRGKAYEVVVSCDPNASYFGVTVPVFVPNAQMLATNLSALPHTSSASKFRGLVSVRGLPPGESIVEGLPLAVVAAVMGANLDAHGRDDLNSRLWYGNPYHNVPWATQGVFAVRVQSNRHVVTCNPPNWLREHISVDAVDGITHLLQLFEGHSRNTHIRFQDFNGYTESNLATIVEAVTGMLPIVFVGHYDSAARLLCDATVWLSKPMTTFEKINVVERHNLAGMTPPASRPIRRLVPTMSDVDLWGTITEPGSVPLADEGWVIAKDLSEFRDDTVWKLFDGSRHMMAGQFETNYRLAASYVPKHRGSENSELEECVEYLESLGVHDGYYMTWCPPNIHDDSAATTNEAMMKRILAR